MTTTKAKEKQAPQLPDKLAKNWIYLSDAMELLKMPRRTIDRKRRAKVFGKEEKYLSRVILSRAAVDRYLDQYKVR